jgi:hypothetical protein
MVAKSCTTINPGWLKHVETQAKSPKSWDFYGIAMGFLPSINLLK